LTFYQFVAGWSRSILEGKASTYIAVIERVFYSSLCSCFRVLIHLSQQTAKFSQDFTEAATKGSHSNGGISVCTSAKKAADTGNDSTIKHQSQQQKEIGHILWLYTPNAKQITLQADTTAIPFPTKGHQHLKHLNNKPSNTSIKNRAHTLQFDHFLKPNFIVQHTILIQCCKGRNQGNTHLYNDDNIECNNNQPIMWHKNTFYWDRDFCTFIKLK
jgi:hypothetical protein